MEDELTDWTKDEKLLLYHGIKTYGSHNIDQICEMIPGKTPEAVKEAIIHFQGKALKQEHNFTCTTQNSKTKYQPLVPLNSWANVLTETFPFNELRTETAIALRLIADFEDLPSAVCSEKIDFRKVYHTLANALEGKALCEDKLVAEVIDKCIVETALTSKAFTRCSAYKNALNEIRIKEKNWKPFLKPTENNELSILRRLATHKNYNPLNIPEHHLKYSNFA